MGGTELHSICSKLFLNVPDALQFNLTNAPTLPVSLSSLEQHSTALVDASITSPCQPKLPENLPSSAAVDAMMPAKITCMPSDSRAAAARNRIERDARDLDLAAFLDPKFIRPTAASRAAAPPTSAEFMMSLEESQMWWDKGAATFHFIISQHTTTDHDDLIHVLSPEIYQRFTEYQFTHSTVHSVAVPEQAQVPLQAPVHNPSHVHELASQRAPVPLQERKQVHSPVHSDQSVHVQAQEQEQEHTPVESLQEQKQEHPPIQSVQPVQSVNESAKNTYPILSGRDESAPLPASTPRHGPERPSGGVCNFPALKSANDGRGALAELEAAWLRSRRDFVVSKPGGAVSQADVAPLSTASIIPTLASPCDVSSCRLKINYIPDEPILHDLPTTCATTSYAASNFDECRFVSSFFPFHVILGDG